LDSVRTAGPNRCLLQGTSFRCFEQERGSGVADVRVDVVARPTMRERADANFMAR